MHSCCYVAYRMGWKLHKILGSMLVLFERAVQCLLMLMGLGHPNAVIQTLACLWRFPFWKKSTGQATWIVWKHRTVRRRSRLNCPHWLSVWKWLQKCHVTTSVYGRWSVFHLILLRWPLWLSLPRWHFDEVKWQMHTKTKVKKQCRKTIDSEQRLFHGSNHQWRIMQNNISLGQKCSYLAITHVLFFPMCNTNLHFCALMLATLMTFCHTMWTTHNVQLLVTSECQNYQLKNLVDSCA